MNLLHTSDSNGLQRWTFKCYRTTFGLELHPLMGGRRKNVENIARQRETTICHRRFAKKFLPASPFLNSELKPFPSSLFCCKMIA